jgi:Ca2+-transporting ATPase
MNARAIPSDRLEGLLSSARGLTAAEACERVRRHGRNDIAEEVRSTWRDLTRDTVRDPMIWFLLGTGALYALVGERLEAATVIAALLPLVGMDAFLHRRTRASTAGLKSRLATHATVVRDGTTTVVPAGDVVPGDLALVGTGDAFPADGLIVAGTAPQVDESTLTGEAYPVRKRPLDGAPADATVAAVHWGFAGTRLLAGQASLRVAFTGSETIYGEIVRSARAVTRRTPLQAAVASLVSVLVVVASVACLILAFVRLRQGYGWLDAVLSAVTLAVAALPEEFPVVLTVFLGVGVYRLARRQALVRRAVSVENIGRTTCICADKTGTMTEGRLRLTHLLPAPGTSRARLLALAGAASRPEGGDPLDAAIARERPEAIGAPLATFPFTEGRRRETAVVRAADGRALCATKGALEAVLAMIPEGLADAPRWTDAATALAEAGHKVIACAWRLLDEATWPGGEPDRGYRLAGLLAFEDPVREGVAEAVAACRDAGIHAIMLTGDHPGTARAVAREIGLGGATPVAITGDEIEAQGPERLRQVDIVARALPAQKLALVRALQEAGEIVAVTGDGVNDVPALQAADVGIAMGGRGTRSARESAALVLFDDNFRTIVHALAEGRQLFRNLKLSFQYLLMIHIPLVVSAAFVPLAGYPLLYLPVHIVWLELLIHPTALLVFQDLPDGTLVRARGSRDVRFFSRREWALIGVTGALVTALVIVGYVHGLGAGTDVRHARSLALAALTVASAGLVVALSGLRTPIARAVAAATTILSVLLIQLPGVSPLLGVEPLHLDDWGMAFGGALLALAPLALLGRPGRQAQASSATDAASAATSASQPKRARTAAASAAAAGGSPWTT